MFARGRVAGRGNLSAPIGGLNSVDALSNMPPNDAYEMVNMDANESSVDIRKGYRNLLQSSHPNLQTLLTYDDGQNDILFMAGGDRIQSYDEGTNTLSDSKTGLLSSVLSWVNFGTPQARFLMVVNGENTPFYFNGIDWIDSSITYAGLDTSKLILVTSFKNRLFFALQNSLKIYYLGTQSIAGALSEIDLSSLFSSGGKISGIATLSIDGGDGIDDLIAFITDQGQVALYQGSNPNSAADWRIVGLFDIGRPVGRRFYAKVGGDVLLLTAEGVLSLSEIYRDARLARKDAPGRKVNPLLIEHYKERGQDDGWFIKYNAAFNRLYVNVPLITGRTVQYVMNVITGAWTKYENIQLFDMIQNNENIYGVSQSDIRLLNDGYTDGYEADENGAVTVDGEAISVICKQAYNAFGTAENKDIASVQPFFEIEQSHLQSDLYYDVDFDFSDLKPENQIVLDIAADDLPLWGDALWGIAILSSGILRYQDINTMGGEGVYLSVSLCASSHFKSFKWHASNILYEVAEGL